MGEGLLRIWKAGCDCERQVREEQTRVAAYEQQQQTLNRRFAQAHLDERFLDATFATFNRVPGTEDALDASREFVEQFALRRAEGRGLLLVGENGCGKTHLVAAIVHALTREHGQSCLFITTIDYYDQLRQRYDIERAGGIS